MNFQTKKSLRILDTGIVDGEIWYTVFCRDKDFYEYIQNLNKKGYYVHKGEMLVDVHEKIMTMLQLKYTCYKKGEI